MRKILSAFLLVACVAIPTVHANELAAPWPIKFSEQFAEIPFPSSPVPQEPSTADTASDMDNLIDRAFNYIGVAYRRGGSTPDTGFDCSGFVGYLYDQTFGLVLPRKASAIAQQGERIEKSELQPGDLVFFNTMRRAFSHVGIYLGDNRFIHAPRTGQRVRIEDMSVRYWSLRFNGARRIHR